MGALDTGTDDLLARVEDGVALVALNPTERRDALTGAILKALAGVLAGLEADDDVACVVLTGAGGAFCAGGDVKDMAAGGDGEAVDAPGAPPGRQPHQTAG